VPRAQFLLNMKKLSTTFIASNFNFVLCFDTGFTFAEKYITQCGFLDHSFGAGFQTQVLWLCSDLRDSLK